MIRRVTPQYRHAQVTQWFDNQAVQGVVTPVAADGRTVVGQCNFIPPLGATVQINHIYSTFLSDAADTEPVTLYLYIGPPFLGAQPAITPFGPVTPSGFSARQYFDIFTVNNMPNELVFHTVDLVNPVLLSGSQAVGMAAFLANGDTATKMIHDLTLRGKSTYQ